MARAFASLRVSGKEAKARAIEALEIGLKRGGGRVNIYVLADEGEPVLWRYSTGLHCPDSDIRYQDPQPALFSFNSAMGACDTCRGFGRVIGVDWGLVIPDHRKTLRSGAIKTLQTPAWAENQADLMRYAGEAGIPRDTAWSQLTEAQRAWVIDGTPNWKGSWNKQWYGIRRFFEYLESKAYKMHIRVLLSKYRSYTTCPTCHGARLKTEALLWRMGTKADADGVLAVWALLRPELAQKHAKLIVAAAECGDFDEWPDDERGMWLEAAIASLSAALNVPKPAVAKV